MAGQTAHGRRQLLLSGVSALVCSVMKPAIAATWARLRDQRQLSFYNLHTGESLDTVYWADGTYVPGALREVDRVLRDFRTGDVYSIDRRLLDLLVGLRQRLETDEPFQVISGYRSPQTNALLHAHSEGVAARSLHMDGMAIDIRVPGRALNSVRAAALDLQSGGVGYYPASDFVHVDTGRIRCWG